MDGTYSPEQLAELIKGGLLVGARLYRERADGSLQYNGVRPGPEWHAHGYMRRSLVAKPDGGQVVVWKPRWRSTVEGASPLTVHSRPPDDLASVVAWARSGSGSP